LVAVVVVAVVGVILKVGAIVMKVLIFPEVGVAAVLGLALAV
jgi:hypothetical protein